MWLVDSFRTESSISLFCIVFYVVFYVVFCDVFCDEQEFNKK